MIDLDNLNKLTIDQLRALASQHGVIVHHRMKEDTLIKHISEKMMAPQVNKKELKHVAELPKTTPKINTEEEIREACAKYFSKEGYQATFKDDIWHFKYAGSEDSGHMSVPLRIIRMKAEQVSHGARKPMTMNFDGDKIFAAG